jgi:hypothetical protein
MKAEQVRAQQIQEEQKHELHARQQAIDQQIQVEHRRVQMMEQARLEEIRRQTLKAFQHITPEEHEKQLKEFFAMQERQAEEEDRKEERGRARLEEEEDSVQGGFSSTLRQGRRGARGRCLALCGVRTPRLIMPRGGRSKGGARRSRGKAQRSDGRGGRRGKR